MASSSTAATLKDAGFFIKNIPNSFNEWNLFDIFAAYGLVGYCRIGGKSTDKESQFGFVNMLTVDAADEVRKAMKDQKLTGNGFCLYVSDVKDGTMTIQPIHAVKPGNSKYPPIVVPSGYLPLNKELSVEIVELLPMSTVPSHVFLLTIRLLNDEQTGALYKSMNEKLNTSQLYKIDGELPIGTDCLCRVSSKSVARARRITETELYLIDEGKRIAYDKSKCFSMPKYFSAIPTRVFNCTLDGLFWVARAVDNFPKIRQVVIQWGLMEKDRIRAKTFGFKGPLNCISLYAGNSVLTEKLVTKGIAERQPRRPLSETSYDRDTMLKLKSCEGKPEFNKEIIEDLVKSVENVHLA
ncbi:unnamed protein product [Caenorhabditis bovis]|uniref:RRM domain-containing protein n=1 Tax=Caenorhabditis bovis TaxID=2654633 RepID=A0A8S1EXW6_9PELO|nr:unnamed protein product [Caenorhabditis bovis]